MMQLTLRRGAIFVAALLLLGAAIAVAVATHGSGTANGAAATQRVAKKGDPDALASAKEKPGEAQPGVAQAAAEDYAHRAFPGTEVPLSASKRAIKAFATIKDASVGKFLDGSWQMVGPRAEDYPAVLTFFGTPYVASGRITALAISNQCTQQMCRMWVGAAGGGVWRTDQALSNPPGQSWQLLSTPFGTNAIGTLTYTGGVLYAGTGEPNASGDSEAGLGIWKSTDDGQTWSKLPSITHTNSVSNGDYTGDAFANRSISSIVVDYQNPSIIYVSSTRGVRGVASVTGNAVSTPPPPRPPFGLYKSTDGGQTFDFIWNGNGTLRGVNHTEIDPFHHKTVYAAAFQQGIWRTKDGGITWKQIFEPLNPLFNTDRAEFDVTPLGTGKTRMYVGDGAQGDIFDGDTQVGFAARVYRTDDAETTNPVFIDLTNDRNSNYCTGQCWYDNFVVTPAGHPDMVYLGGSFDYNSYGFSTNGRGILLSVDEGLHWSDVTADATQTPRAAGNCCWPNPNSPHGMHPDQHGFAVNPNNPAQFFSGNDGGLERSSGVWKDISQQCEHRATSRKARCKELLSRVPTLLTPINDGLATLQFQSLSVNPFDSTQVMGGTQDNGTMQGIGTRWPQIIYGDGGLSGWNAKDPTLRFNSYFGQFHDANFRNGDPLRWVIISGDIAASPESSNFYVPIIADPHPDRAGTIFEGSQSVWRTKDWGGDRDYLEANCPEFYVSGADPDCGDFVRIGNPSDLTGAGYGGDRTNCCVAALARTRSDKNTLWAATNGGRVFITHNSDAGASSVQWTRLDSLATNDPGRSITSIFVDPNNSNHAYISYTGYNFNTPTTPGHVFSVMYNPGAGTATWTMMDGTSLADLPVTSVVYDWVLDDLYASTDFGVLRLSHENMENGSNTWTVAATGMPNVEVAGLTIVPGDRKLYAATHGMSAWLVNLPAF
jgi:hypothetical protein